LFSTGYMANLGVITSLLGRDDMVFADRLNHASLNDACLLSRAAFKRFAHNDLAQLDTLLGASNAKRKLIAVDAVFSMDGDIAPLPELLALVERHDAWLLVDDAHGLGVLGAHGRGVLEHFGVYSDRVVYMGTLGKAAGVFGAFAAGSAELCEWLVQRARTYIYTTAMPPLLACALLKSVALMEQGAALRSRLADNISLLRQLLAAGLPECWRLLPSATAIQPLIIGDNRESMRIAANLAERGVLVPAIRPPTVPAGTARLRISLSAAHTADDIRVLAHALHHAATS
jgi:8-amino-7-oxononanoate synthase